MISFLTHLSATEKNVTQLLSDTAEALWDELNPKKTDGHYHQNALVSKAQNLCGWVQTPAHIETYGEPTALRHLAFSQYIANPVNLKHIVTALPDAFDAIIKTVSRHLSPGDLYQVIDNETRACGFGAMLLKKVFNYENYRRSENCANRYKKLGLNKITCPYCNDTTMIIVPDKPDEDSKPKVSKVLFDIDHFYPKHVHPYLALSFYNHIPSCKICNQAYKGVTEFTIDTHIHPYHRCFDSLYRFETNHGIVRDGPLTSVKLIKTSDFDDDLPGNLQLEARYNETLSLARSSRLIEILFKYRHFLKEGHLEPAEYERLIERLLDFGVVFKKDRILGRSYGKLQRDIVKVFDPANLLKL